MQQKAFFNLTTLNAHRTTWLAFLKALRTMSKKVCSLQQPTIFKKQLLSLLHSSQEGEEKKKKRDSIVLPVVENWSTQGISILPDVLRMK